MRREREARRRRRGWLALILVLLLTTLAAVTGWYLTEGRFTSAPALSTLSRSDAAAVADGAHLQVDFTDGYSETVPAGQVVSTEPVAGARVRKGSHIEAVLSRGPERFAMPNVVGLTSDAATAALRDTHLKVGKVTSRWSETVGKGVVLSAGQDAGRRSSATRRSRWSSAADPSRSSSPTGAGRTPTRPSPRSRRPASR